jgi:hypothetical protein
MAERTTKYMIGGFLMLGIASPAHASDFSGVIPILMGIFLGGLALFCLAALGLTRILPGAKNKWLIWGIMMASFFVVVVRPLLGFSFW